MYKTLKERKRQEDRKEKELKEIEKKTLNAEILEIANVIISLKEEKTKLLNKRNEKLEEIKKEKLELKGLKTILSKRKRESLKLKELQVKEEYEDQIEEINEKIKGQEELKEIIKERKQNKQKVNVHGKELIDDIELDEEKLEIETDVLDIVQEYKNKKIELKSEIIMNNKKVIKRIVHTADIHIRLSSLHKEYEIIFNRLYESIKEIKEEILIVICGDLLHTKNELDPDTIMFVLDFLKNLSKISPVIIIAGNHDCFEHSDKVDSITAILEERLLPDVHYLKESGIYIYNNIIFGVSSIKDKNIL